MPDLRILVTGTGADDEMILKALAAGAKGYVDEGATPAEFFQAIQIVNQGSVWAPRRVLSMFIERVTTSPGRIFPAGRVVFTDREKEVLELLVAGTVEQRDWQSSRHRRTNSESARGETYAQGWRAESDRAFGSRHHAFAGESELNVTLVRVQGTKGVHVLA